jgi:hypothetical protein
MGLFRLAADKVAYIREVQHLPGGRGLCQPGESGTPLNGWRSADIHQTILTAFGLSATAYALAQLRYDLREMKAHGLLQRIGRAYCYRLTDKGSTLP